MASRGDGRAFTRYGVFLGCALGIVLALGSGLDRATTTHPKLARFVPSAFAANTAIVRSNAALSAHRYREALVLAEAAIRAAPVEPESPGLLGGALLGTGNFAEAERAFMVAGQFGWRTPLTQYYWMQQALAANDYRVAALRLDAMLRADPELVANQALLGPLEATPAGRAELAGRMLEQPGWLARYARDVTDVAPEVALSRADVLDILARKGKPLGCVDAGPLTTVIANSGNILRAHAIWRAQCPQRVNGLVADADFTHLKVLGPDSPFDWVVIGDSDVSLSVDAAGTDRHRRLVIASSAAFPRKVLAQLLPMAPGRYRLEWSANTEAGKPSDRIRATIACNADSREWLNATFDPVRHKFMTVVTVDGSCPARWIGFSIFPGGDALSFGWIALNPLR